MTDPVHTDKTHPMPPAAQAIVDRHMEAMMQELETADFQSLGVVMGQRLAELKAAHPSVGDVRSIGLFGIVELVRDRKTLEPLAPFNGTSPEMQALGKFFREEGLYTFLRWNTFFTNPPLCITEAEMAEAFAIIDKGLYITDRAIAGA